MQTKDTESVLIDGTAYDVHVNVAAELLRLHIEVQQQAAPAPQPKNIRVGAPYDNPAFEQLARFLGVWGTAQSAVCAQFWLAASPAEDAQEAAAELAALRDVYEQARGVLRHDGINMQRAIKYRDGLIEAIEAVKTIDGGNWEPDASQAAPAAVAVPDEHEAFVDGAWYWVEREVWGNEPLRIDPAMYKANCDAWYSYAFGGIPTRQLKVLEPCVMQSRAALAATPAADEPALPRACDLLSMAIGTLMGQRAKIGYTDNSPIASVVSEAVEFLRPWPEKMPVAAAAPAVPKWIDDPHDIEQGQMLNPEWVKAQETAVMVFLPFSARTTIAKRHGMKVTAEFNALVREVIAEYRARAVPSDIAAAAPVVLPEPFALYDGEKWYANEEAAICSCADMAKLQKVFIESQLPTLLAGVSAPAAQVVPDGWTLVPVDLTPEMKREFMDLLMDGIDIYVNRRDQIEIQTDAPRRIWKAVLALSPAAPQAQADARDVERMDFLCRNAKLVKQMWSGALVVSVDATSGDKYVSDLRVAVDAASAAQAAAKKGAQP